jgi:hypothetical protein
MGVKRSAHKKEKESWMGRNDVWQKERRNAVSDNK